MSAIKHFTDLEVWQRSHLLFLDISNIAEGFNRSKAKFLSALDIDANFLGTEEANARTEQTKIISRMLIALIHGIESKPDLSRSNRQLSTVNCSEHGRVRD